MSQLSLLDELPRLTIDNPDSQWARVYAYLLDGPKDTNFFCSAHGLSAEYRRAIVELRVKLPKGWTVKATPLTRKNWVYEIARAA